MQSLANGVFVDGLNSTLLDSFIKFDANQMSDVTFGEKLSVPLNAQFASYIMNYFGAMVCSRDSVGPVCLEDPKKDDKNCCEWEGNKEEHVCKTWFSCNNPVASSPNDCRIQGGFEHNGSGISNDILNKLKNYGNLDQACQVLDDKKVGGWNLNVGDCRNVMQCPKTK